MTDIVAKVGFFIALIIIGFLLYKIGNFIWGKPCRGGKRLVLFVLGVGLGALSIAIMKAIDLNTAKEWFLLGVSLMLALGCLWVLFCCIFSRPKELDKQFDNILDSF